MMISLFLKRLFWYIPVKIFARCYPYSQNIREDLSLDHNSHIVYVLQSNSISDLLTLEKLTRKQRLPNPFSTLEINKTKLPRSTFLKKTKLFSNSNEDYNFEPIFKEWLTFCKENNCNLQVIPVTIFWNRNPGKEGEPFADKINQPISSFRKFFRLLFLGFDNLVMLSGPINTTPIIKNNKEENTIKLLARACRVHFERRYKEIIGPKIPDRKLLINQLLNNENIINAITKVSNETGKNYSEIESKANDILNEIVSDISYHLIRVMASILHLLWNKLYHGIKIVNADKVRELIRSGHEIVYVPCHRSHMDYLLLAYVMYYERLSTPHIVSGNNLNFFPINVFLRKCGAFFMRRKFKGDLLYTTIFREYLNTLFIRGYSTEFFIEGGRSRTGRMLPPRTGLVAMAVQSQLRGNSRPITFIPTYLGYEKVMEVNTYMKELNGAQKEKESVLGLLNIYKRFKYYGRGYVSFGDPLSLPTFLRDYVPNWRDDINDQIIPRPSWLFDTVNSISDEIVMRLNEFAAVNGVNLCALAILSSRKVLTFDSIISIINFYLFILKSSTSTKQSIIPNIPGDRLLQQALELNAFTIVKVNNENIIKPTSKQIIYLTYFRNNIIHFFALPALISMIIIVNKIINLEDIIMHTRNVFYFLRHELFSPVREDILNNTIMDYLHAFQLNEYLIKDGEYYSINNNKTYLLHTLTDCIQPNLIRYLVGAYTAKEYNTKELSSDNFVALCVEKCKRLPKEITYESPEFSDPITFKVMTETFIRHQYLEFSEDNVLVINNTKIYKLVNAVCPLLPSTILDLLSSN